ncbi:putative importin 13 protein [Coleophoma crateriformis]|uniref:Putative importin 13 protein n=1 Tax=Coleophoma crateriformis TaxID=565419 RepID=A0A3D8R8D6_9HELO|nr:putative importin 13 protein [Coleophoma crateriformis]
MEEIQYPQSLREVEELILQLYQPGSPQRVGKIQETLQSLQRSSDGWQLANSLLGNADEKVRFFGALTFIVKLNTDSKSLTEEEARGLLQNLINWLIQSLEAPGGPLVVKKLCSVLVAYFMHFSESWTQCVKHIILSLSANNGVPYDAVDSALDTANLMEGLSDAKLLAIFWFSTALVEEVGKTDSASMKQNQFHRHLLPNIADIVNLLQKTALHDPPNLNQDSKIRQESMRCYQAWVHYSHRAFIDAEIMLEPLRALTRPAIMCLLQDDLYEVTIELFTDVLANYSRFFGEEDFKLLYSLFTSPWAQQRYDRLIQGDFDFDSLQFGMFLIAFGDATVQDLVRNLDTDSQASHLLSSLCGLLGATGPIINEDKIFVPAVEFWATFVETMIDYSYSEDGKTPPWFQSALSYLMKAVENCWRKIQFPPMDNFKEWDSAERTAFKDARKDVGDLLEQSYTQTGSIIFSMFVDLILRSLENEAWAELEASIYCLNSFADCISSDQEACDALLDKVFGSSIFALFTDPEKDMPPRVRQTFLDLIAAYPNHFERHTKYLPNALDLLFKAVDSLPRLAVTASKSIHSLCSSCRNVLVPEIGAFLQQYSKLAGVASLDSLAKEKITGAIASIIQAIPEESSKVAPVSQLLSYVEEDMQQCLHILASWPSQQSQPGSTMGSLPNPGEQLLEGASARCLGSLRCLESMAKGLQVPSDVPVDLDTSSTLAPLWLTGEGASVQQRILRMIITALDTFRGRGDVVEAVCYIFRAGFTETEPGPFVLSVADVATIIMRFGIRTPRLGFTINTACSLVSSQCVGSAQKMDGVARDLLVWVTNLMLALEEPSNDTEIAQNGIDFLSRLASKHLGVLIAHQPSSSIEYLFMFTLKSLTGKDFLPKASAAEFWAHLLASNGNESHIQATLDSMLQHLGPLLAEALIYNIGGSAARSELDKLSEPLKKLVANQVRSKNWLEAALQGANFPSGKVTDAEKRVFLQKVMR